ncbi:uncharacterized protein LOC130787492 isoform X3 [Actinidia eriantha]|uniref:uncharacterized protein LOC130787492 isoform X3 n=1 Tax=Actinidia eriantha TaxID=165200 RepID=UPI00258F1D62|nr:uncharacterized protein LOC130787492 isoform X3 [Actinidia eriantha]
MEMVYNHQNSGIDEQVEVIFRCKDGMTTYGRIIVKQVDEVMSTAQPCDLAYEFGDRLLDIHEYPSGFPRAGEEILTTSNPTWYEIKCYRTSTEENMDSYVRMVLREYPSSYSKLGFLFICSWKAKNILFFFFLVLRTIINEV